MEKTEATKYILYLDTTRLASATVVVSRLILGLLCIASYKLENGWEFIYHLEEPLPETNSISSESDNTTINCLTVIVSENKHCSLTL